MGSQTQSTTSQTVMGVFQALLHTLGIDDIAVASGRTDRGVHATGQVLHVSLPQFWSNLVKLKTTLNIRLPKSLHVRKIDPVASDFHARYSAQKRIYRYILSERESNPFEASYVTFTNALDFEKISEAITLFEGVHDFKHFMKEGGDTQTSVREIYRAFAYRHHDKTVLYFEANGYLRSQIRLMVGFLLKISRKKLLLADLKEQLAGTHVHSRTLAPPNGLYLAKVIY